MPQGYGASGGTIQRFVAGQDMTISSRADPALLSLRAKVAALLYRSTWLGSICSAGKVSSSASP